MEGACGVAAHQDLCAHVRCAREHSAAGVAAPVDLAAVEEKHTSVEGDKVTRYSTATRYANKSEGKKESEKDKGRLKPA